MSTRTPSTLVAVRTAWYGECTYRSSSAAASARAHSSYGTVPAATPLSWRESSREFKRAAQYAQTA
eukprot:scaffold309457_cov19-Prasinocladus_malaysianus.AAC.2